MYFIKQRLEKKSLQIFDNYKSMTISMTYMTIRTTYDTDDKFVSNCWKANKNAIHIKQPNKN